MYTTEENKAFMKELNEGYVPKEIHDKYKGKKICVSLEDRREEEYRPPTPPKFVAYSGVGQVVSQMKGLALGGVNKEADSGVVVNEDKPKTTI